MPRPTPRPQQYPTPPILKVPRVAKVLPSHVRILTPQFILWRDGEPPYDQDHPLPPIRVVSL